MRAAVIPRRAEGLSVISVVSAEYGTRPSYVVSRMRYRVLVAARAEIARRLRAAGWSTPEVGALLGRDHSTIVQNERRLVIE